MNAPKPALLQKRKRYYPLCLDIHDKRCVVIGGGAVAERKVRSLLSCGARVDVVSLRLTRGLSLLERRGKIAVRCGAFHPQRLAGAALVIAATDDALQNAAVAHEAARRRIPVNVVDAPALSTFIVPAVLQRGELSVSVSTNGASPFLARQLKNMLARVLGREYAEYARLWAEARQKVRRRYPDPEQRRTVYRRLSASPVLALLRDGRHRQAEALVQRLIGRVPHAD